MPKSLKPLRGIFRIRSGRGGGGGALLARLSLIVVAITGSFAFLGITALSLPQSGVAQAASAAQIQPTRDPSLPTPTPPAGWQQRPNLHILLTDQDGQPVGGVQLAVYSFRYNAATAQYEIKKVLDGAVTAQGTDIQAGAGWANLDAASILYGMYSLEMREPDGSLILPFDPNGPYHYGTGGNSDPLTFTTSLLDLSQGDVAYVYHFQVRPLIAGPLSRATPYPIPAGAPTPKPTPTLAPAALAAKRAVFFRATEKWIYFPGGSAPLAQVATVTPGSGSGSGTATTTATSNLTGNTPNQPTAGAGTVTTNPTSSGSLVPVPVGDTTPSPGAVSNSNSSSNSGVAGDNATGTPQTVATVGNIVHQELGGLPPGAHLVTSGANPNIAIIVYDKDYTPPPATATALPTPTSQYEAQNCGQGCISTAQAPTATAYAATAFAAMTAGVWTPDGRDAGRNGGAGLPASTGGGNSKNLSTTSTSGAGSGALTVVAAAGAGSTAGAANNPAANSTGASANKISGGSGGGFPWLPVLGVVGGLALLGLAGWLNRRRTERQQQSQGQTFNPTSQRPGPPPTKPQS